MRLRIAEAFLVKRLASHFPHLKRAHDLKAEAKKIASWEELKDEKISEKDILAFLGIILKKALKDMLQKAVSKK